jgi:hypothetical protein
MPLDLPGTAPAGSIALASHGKSSRTWIRALSSVNTGAVASGTKGRLSGIPRQEALTQPGETPFGGFLVDLVGIRDIEHGVIETYLGAAFEMGINVLWTSNQHEGIIGFSDMNWYRRLLSGDSFAGRKFRDAHPVQIFGYMVGSAGGSKLEHPVKTNLILVRCLENSVFDFGNLTCYQKGTVIVENPNIEIRNTKQIRMSNDKMA